MAEQRIAKVHLPEATTELSQLRRVYARM